MSSQGKGTNAIRDWTIVGDDRTFYFVINAFSNSTPQGYGCSHYGFGEFNSLRKNDPYNYMLISTESTFSRLIRQSGFTVAATAKSGRDKRRMPCRTTHGYTSLCVETAELRRSIRTAFPLQRRLSTTSRHWRRPSCLVQGKVRRRKPFSAISTTSGIPPVFAGTRPISRHRQRHT